MIISVEVRSRDPEQEEMSWHARSRHAGCFRLCTPQHLNMSGMKFNLSIQGPERSNVLEAHLNESSLWEVLYSSNAGVEMKGGAGEPRAGRKRCWKSRIFRW